MAEIRVGILGHCVPSPAAMADRSRPLRDLLDQEQRWVGALHQVVIETSGLADPVPVMFSLATDPVLRHQFDVPLVVVTLAAIDAELQIRRYEEVRKQIIAAHLPAIADGARCVLR